MKEVEVILKGRRAILLDWGYPGRPKSKRSIPASKLAWFWSYPVTIEKLTLRDLFELLARLTDEQLRMLECLTMCNIRPFLEEARRGRRSKTRKLWRVDVQTTVSLDERGGWMNVRSEMRGRVRGSREKYALDLSPVPELLDCEVRVEPKATVTRGYLPKDEIGSFEYELTLGELLGAVFEAVAFFGTPSQREAAVEELRRRFEEARSGKVKGIPLEEVLREVKRPRRSPPPSSPRSRKP